MSSSIIENAFKLTYWYLKKKISFWMIKIIGKLFSYDTMIIIWNWNRTNCPNYWKVPIQKKTREMFQQFYSQNNRQQSLHQQYFLKTTHVSMLYNVGTFFFRFFFSLKYFSHKPFKFIINLFLKRYRLYFFISILDYTYKVFNSMQMLDLNWLLLKSLINMINLCISTSTNRCK